MRTVRTAGVLVLVAAAGGAGLFARVPSAGAQPPTQLSCTASAQSPPVVPGEGEADLLSDLLLTCTGGTPTVAGQTVPQANIVVAFDTDETSRIIATPQAGFSLTDATLLADDPAPANQSPCATTKGPVLPYVCQVAGTGGSGTYSGAAGHPNVFYAYAGSPQSPTQFNAITFYGVPLDPPGEGPPLTLRLANLRGNAAALGGGPGLAQVEASISIQGASSVQINNPVVTLAYAKQSLSLSLLDAAGTGPLGTPPTLDSCAGSSADAVLAPAEAFAGALETRTTAGTGTADQDAPATVYGNESGFVNSAFPAPLGTAGLADFGARLVFSFSGPAGVAVTLPTTASLTSGGGAAGSLQMISDPTAAYTPVGGTSATLTLGSQPVSAAYEVVSSTAGDVEAGDVPVTVAAPAGTAAGTVTVGVGYGPLETSAAQQKATAGPIPRFESSLPAENLATVEGCTFVIASGSQAYGSTSPAFTYTTNPAGATLAGSLVCTTVDDGTPIAAALPVGNHTIDGASCSGLTAQGTGVGTSGAAGGFVVTPVPLSITASSGSMVYGSTAPAITAGYEGFVAGDTSASLTAQPTCGSSATATSPVGTYPTTCTGAVDTNYDISYSPGSLAVVPDATATTVQPSLDPADSGAAVSFDAAVTAAAPGSGTPSGNVTFSLADAAGQPVAFSCGGGSDTVDLVGGLATCAVQSGVLLGTGGPYVMSVTYGGDSNFTGSAGSAHERVVDAVVKVVAAVGDATPDVGASDTITLVATAERIGSTGPGRVVVTDVLPSGVSYVSAGASAGSVSRSGRTLTWVIVGLRPGGSATLSIAVSVPGTAVSSDRASFTQTVPTAAGATTGRSNQVTITPLYAVLSIHESALKATLEQGSTDGFVETVESRGPDAARGVVVTSPIPSGVKVTSITVSQGSATQSVVDGVATITWKVGTVAAGADPTMHVDVTVTASPGTVLDQAAVTDSTYDPSGRRHTSSASVVVTAVPVVPATHTGEPWSGWPYWALVATIGALGLAALESGRRRRRPAPARVRAGQG